MNNRLSRIMIHLVVVVMIFILPEVVMIGNRPFDVGCTRWIPYLKVSVFVLVFYVEYFLAGPGMSRARFVLGSCAMLIIGGTVFYIMSEYMGHFTQRHPPVINIVIRDGVMLLLTMGLSVAMRLSERVRKIEETHREEELKHLKSQLNPHFLFNSLNTVYALTEIDPPLARDAVHRLSALLRYALYEADNPTVKLGREVAFVRDYVRLMQMRLGEGVNVSIAEEVAAGMENAEIASMLFITLVENAFKHGNAGTTGSYVTIRISASERGEVECDVANSVADDRDAEGRGGMGLENLRRRLRLIYGSRARLEISSQPAIFVAQMRIQL